MKHSPHNLENIAVWRKAVDLSVQLFKVVKGYPAQERFGLSSQTTRAAVSVAANIAEGAGRNTRGEFLQFLGIARGSCYELKTLIVIAREAAILSETDSQGIELKISEILRMLFAFSKSLESQPLSKTKA